MDDKNKKFYSKLGLGGALTTNQLNNFIDTNKVPDSRKKTSVYLDIENLGTLKRDDYNLILRKNLSQQFYHNFSYKMGDLAGILGYHRNLQKPYPDPILKEIEIKYKEFKIKNKLKDYDDLLEDVLTLLKKDPFSRLAKGVFYLGGGDTNYI
jgi:hypothetical protein